LAHSWPKKEGKQKSKLKKELKTEITLIVRDDEMPSLRGTKQPLWNNNKTIHNS
jgi:hypothetical protein